jgi:flagellar basal body-associated protein FliL
MHRKCSTVIIVIIIIIVVILVVVLRVIVLCFQSGSDSSSRPSIKTYLLAFGKTIGLVN